LAEVRDNDKPAGSSSFSLPTEARDTEPEKPAAEALDIQSDLVERVAAMGLKESRYSQAAIDRARACELLDQAIARYGLRWVVWAVTLAASRANPAKGRKPVEAWSYVTTVLTAWRSGSSEPPYGWPVSPGARKEAPLPAPVVVPPAPEEREQRREWWAGLKSQFPGLRLAEARERSSAAGGP
jgi:hypothetical protein